MQNALQGLASGTMDLREAATAFIQDIASAMAGLASQNLAKMASDSLSGLFASGAGAAGDAASAASGAVDATASASAAFAATALATGLGATTVASTTATGAMGAAATAAGVLAGALTAAASAAAASATGDALTTGAKVLAAATGGQVLGPGTGTSDSIAAWLSNTEFVTRAAVVTQPGALGFLHDFNARGMAALDDWARAVHHSTGGLAGVPAPARPSPNIGRGRLAEPSANFKTEVANNFRFNTFFDRDEMARSLGQSSTFRDVLIEVAQSNPRALREALNS